MKTIYVVPSLLDSPVSATNMETFFGRRKMVGQLYPRYFKKVELSNWAAET